MKKAKFYYFQKIHFTQIGINLKKHYLLNYILPNEDIEDINFIKKY